jgi:hypothetical protein
MLPGQELERVVPRRRRRRRRNLASHRGATQGGSSQQIFSRRSSLGDPDPGLGLRLTPGQAGPVDQFPRELGQGHSATHKQAKQARNNNWRN